jgi:hypothetical protein
MALVDRGAESRYRIKGKMLGAKGFITEIYWYSKYKVYGEK